MKRLGESPDVVKVGQGMEYPLKNARNTISVANL